MNYSADSTLRALALGATLALGCGGNGGAGGGADAGQEDAAGFDGGAPDLDSGTLVVTLDAATRTTVLHGECAALDMVIVAPREADVGEPIQLHASGLAPSAQTDVAITWAATGNAGSLAASGGVTNVFNCTTSGSSTITVTASIADGGASCVDGGSISVVVACD
jgi:hypothetical protein